MLAVWGAPERNPWVTIGFGLLVEHGHMPPPEPTGGPSPFAMASQEGTRALLARAGFTTVHSQEIPVRFTYRDIDGYSAFTADTGGAAAPVLRDMAEAEREALKTELSAAFTPFGSEAGYELPGIALTAVASSDRD